MTALSSTAVRKLRAGSGSSRRISSRRDTKAAAVTTTSANAYAAALVPTSGRAALMSVSPSRPSERESQVLAIPNDTHDDLTLGIRLDGSPAQRESLGLGVG